MLNFWWHLPNLNVAFSPLGTVTRGEEHILAEFEARQRVGDRAGPNATKQPRTCVPDEARGRPSGSVCTFIFARDAASGFGTLKFADRCQRRWRRWYPTPAEWAAGTETCYFGTVVKTVFIDLFHLGYRHSRRWAARTKHWH
jgi:hypothetical protein